MNRSILIGGAILMAVAVILGAFGAHALKEKLPEHLMQVYKTGVEYHFYHALGLLIVGVLALYMPSSLLNVAALFLFAGIILFSGSLYTMAFTGIKWLGAITPLGGLSFIVGWVLLAVAVWKK
ncbi:DUF423 domain-containing protein [Roseimarinus sediminis]|uniref:DUF423 domain-containing protein n=1 Tax=Roseimarinus sediminis TaxID=1610899 RepID=UPI003D1B14E6